MKKSHTCEEGGAHLRISSWKSLKIRNLQKWKKNCRRYHHFTHVYQKKQSYDVQFLRYGVRQRFFCHLGPFFALYLSLHPHSFRLQKAKSFKKWKIHLEMSSFQTCATRNTSNVCAYSDMECIRHNILPF